MDYPATQMFVNDDDENSEDEEDDAATPLRAEKNIKIGTLVVDSDIYPVCRGFNKVGRIDSCAIVIGHDTISKEHAEIEAGLGPKSTFISDLGSLNKTRLNDAVLRPGRLYQLHDGDVLRFGSVRAVFKVDQNRDSENNSKEFVVPETPATTAKETHPIIPGTPDLSFEDVVQDKSTDANRVSDVSLVAGTQQGENTTRQVDTEASDIPKVKDSAIDISDLETQTDLPVQNSDEKKEEDEDEEEEEEENIFDMMTQKTSIRDYETQKYSAVKGGPITTSRRDIHDIETQEFSVNEGRPNATERAEPLRSSINDLETQQFPIVEGRSLSANDTEPHSSSINDLETQRFPIAAESNSHSINDAETQICPANHTSVTHDGGDDSETDEEGLFEDSGGGMIDMFDAPTQVIGRHDKEDRPRPGDLETESNEEVSKVTVEEKRQPEAETETTRREEEPKTENEKTTSDLPYEETSLKPNDSIESKLNNMFDDVNDSCAEEPTQMLTQNLERVLESTQIEKSDIENDKVENIGNDDGNEEEEKNEAMRTDEEATISRETEIMCTQDIFADLPPVDILRWSTNASRSTSEESHASSLNLNMKSKSKSSKKSGLNSSKLSEQSKNIKPVDATHSNSPKSSNPTSKSGPKRVKVAKNEQIVESPKVNRTSLRGSTRSKAKPVSTPTEVDVKVSNSVEEESANAVKKRLPPKKRRFSNSLLSAAATPPSSPKAEASQSPRTSTRSKVKNKDGSSEPSKKSSSIVVRSVNISLGDELPDGPPEAKRPSSVRTKVNSSKPESPILASSSLRRGTRSRKKGDNDSEPEPVVRNKRLRKNTREEDEPSSPPTPVKKARTAVAEGREKEKKSSKTSKQPEPAVEKPSTPRTRRMRHTVTSALVSENDNATQSSLESQEIQAILGNADRGGNASRVEQMRASRSRERGLKGFPLAEESFEIPVDEPKGKKKVGTTVDTLVNKTVAKVQTTMEKFVKPKPPPLQPPAVADSEAGENGRSFTQTRGKRLLASQKAVEKENSGEEIKSKRGRRNTSAVTKRTKPLSSASSSESLDEQMQEVKPVPDVSSPRRGRSSMLSQSPPGRTKYRVLFTGLNDPQLVAIVHNLGGTITEKPGDCTALVTDKVRRTYKFLCAMAMAVPIVPVDWLRESGRRGCFLDTRDFLLEDPAEEAKFKFNLRRTLEMGKNHRLLEGYTIVLTPNTAPPPIAEMKGIIQACGGKVLVRPPATWPNKSLIISRSEDVKNAKKYLTKAPKSVRLLSVEFILTGILRHELNFDEHKLDVE